MGKNCTFLGIQIRTKMAHFLRSKLSAAERRNGGPFKSRRRKTVEKPLVLPWSGAKWSKTIGFTTLFFKSVEKPLVFPYFSFRFLYIYGGGATFLVNGYNVNPIITHVEKNRYSVTSNLCYNGRGSGFACGCLTCAAPDKTMFSSW